MPSLGPGDRAKLRCKAAAVMCSQGKVQPCFFAHLPGYRNPSLPNPLSDHCHAYSLQPLSSTRLPYDCISLFFQSEITIFQFEAVTGARGAFTKQVFIQG